MKVCLLELVLTQARSWRTDRFATYDDYGQCMDSCQKLTQPCDCKVD